MDIEDYKAKFEKGKLPDQTVFHNLLDTMQEGIQGPKGDRGPKGDLGAKGETGEKGDKGTKGETGKGFEGMSASLVNLFDKGSAPYFSPDKGATVTNTPTKLASTGRDGTEVTYKGGTGKVKAYCSLLRKPLERSLYFVAENRCDYPITLTDHRTNSTTLSPRETATVKWWSKRSGGNYLLLNLIGDNDREYKIAIGDIMVTDSNIPTGYLPSPKEFEQSFISKSEIENIVAKGVGDMVGTTTIGSRNLLLNTSKPFVLKGNNTENQAKDAYKLAVPYFKDILNGRDTNIIVSFDYIVEAESEGSFRAQLNTNPWSVGFVPIKFSKGVAKGTAYHTLTLGNTHWDSLATAIGVRADKLEGTLTLSHMSLHKGDIQGPWQPAPEDITNDFTSIEDRLKKLEGGK